GMREAEVLAAIRALKIPSAFFRGQWYVEAPPNCEARLAQLRGERQTPQSDDKAGTRKEKEADVLDWLRERPATRGRADVPPQQGLRLSELPPPDHIKEEKQGESESEQLRARIEKEIPRYESLTDSEKKTLLQITDYEEVPQPVDYRLTYDA